MTKHKVSELEGALLDAAVAKAEGRLEAWWNTNEAYSVEWSDGGPIIERERIEMAHYEEAEEDDRNSGHVVEGLSLIHI